MIKVTNNVNGNTGMKHCLDSNEHRSNEKGETGNNKIDINEIDI